MRLLTLGEVGLAGSSFSRIKPLLLLSYLAIEGAKDRRYVAEFFWPTASDSLNSLSRALTQLRKGAPGAVQADEHRVWATVDSDVQSFLAALEANTHAEAVALYRGPFLQGAYLNDWGVELEEWVYEQRESLATRAQGAMLELAEIHASQGRFGDAAKLAEEAFELAGAPAPEPERLTRYYALLVAGDSHMVGKVKEEAELYDITVELGKDEARGRLQSAFVGRERERRRLSGLPPGQWLWLRGAAGMGKTALLKSLGTTYLQARAGLPYATLEPLLGESLEEGKEPMLRKLMGLSGSFSLDPWEWMDEESRTLLRQLRDLRPEASFIIASREAPPFRVDAVLELGPLDQSDLTRFAGAWEKTEGLPALVGAYLREEPVEHALETRLSSLSETVERVYLALALLEQPDPALVRRALGLSASDMAGTFEALIRSGLTDVSGRVRAQQAAQDFLQSHPRQTGELALSLARLLSGTEAFPLYSRARLLWEEDDLANVKDAYLAWANELLRRGFPQRAAETLDDAPKGQDVTFLKARALERTGRYREASALLKGLPETPELLALSASILRRLGRPEAAQTAAERALDGDAVVRAEALNTLGNLANSRGEHQTALETFRRAATLWQAVGNHARWAASLNNVAIAKVWLGQEAEAAFNEAFEAAGDNPLLQARVFNNLGLVCDRRDEREKAMAFYHKAAERAEQVGAAGTAARAWNNIGALHQREARLPEAEAAYERALLYADAAGERFMIATVLVGQSLLRGDESAFEEALALLVEAGYSHTAEQFRSWAVAEGILKTGMVS